MSIDVYRWWSQLSFIGKSLGFFMVFQPQENDEDEKEDEKEEDTTAEFDPDEDGNLGSEDQEEIGKPKEIDPIRIQWFSGL